MTEPRTGHGLSPWSGSREWLVPVLLALLMGAQIWMSLRQMSITADEADHIHAGYRYLQCNDFGWNPEHPPLVKLVAAAPLLFMRLQDPVRGACGLPNNKALDFRSGHDLVFANGEAVLTAARVAVSTFCLLLLLLTWVLARSMFGVAVANVAAALLAFEPNLLGHGGLATTDVAAGLGIVLVVYALWKYVSGPTLARLGGVGLATGCALCLKHSSVLLVVIIPVLLIGDALREPEDRLRRLGRAAAALVPIALIAFTTLWACYGFRYAARPNSAPVWKNPKLQITQGKLATVVIPALQQKHVLPEAYLAGLQDVLVESQYRRFSFLFGQVHWGGSPIYFPAAALVKLTLPLWTLLAISAAAARFWRRHLRHALFLLWPVAVFFGVAAFSELNIGFRHVFPVIPLIAVFALAGSWEAAQRGWWPKAIVILLLIGNAASSLHSYPNYISYANELFGGPGKAYKYLADSNVDWGQAEKMARNHLLRKRPENCFFIGNFGTSTTDHGIPCGGVSEVQHDVPPVHFSGTLVISSNALAGISDYTGGLHARRIFDGRTPVARLGGSALLVYEGDFDLQPLVTEQRLDRAIASWGQDPGVAVETFESIAASDPENARVHFVLCNLYAMIGRRQDAEAECNRSLEADGRDPLYTAEAERTKATMKLNGLEVRARRQ